ncbi:MAG TPA: spore cortex biosynthesis protein YabQ [Clostridiaceae bacterium]|nr:spore cortex biosynthesis protein YabQ [Clostridiaceae bacterium]
MPVSVENQVYVFLWSIAGGALIALIYDLFRIKRKTIKTGIVAIYFEDLIYWIIVAVVMFAVVYHSNEGEIRGFIFIGTILGVTLYALLLSKIITKFVIFTIRLILRVLKKLWEIIIFPFKLIFKVLSYPAKPLVRLAKKSYRNARAFSRNRITKMKMWRRRYKNKIKKI